MMLITTAIGEMVAYASRRSSQVERHLRSTLALLSLASGCSRVYQIGVVDGLIKGQPGALQ